MTPTNPTEVEVATPMTIHWTCNSCGDEFDAGSDPSATDHSCLKSTHSPRWHFYRDLLISPEGNDVAICANDPIKPFVVSALNSYDDLVTTNQRLREALERLAAKGCQSIYNNRAEGFTCLDNQAEARQRPEKYTDRFRKEVLRVDFPCWACQARTAMNFGD